MSNQHRRTVAASCLALALGLAAPATAQAPGSAFGQSPQQLQQNLERAPALRSPAKPLANPAGKAPNWNAPGPGTAPSSLPPPPAASAAPHPVQTLKPGAPAKNARTMPLAKEKLTKFAPQRAALLQAQTKIRDEQNRVAQGLRGHAAGQQVMERSSANAFAQAPGRTSSLAAAAAARSPLSAGNAKTQDTLASQPIGIWSVNGKGRDFVITPGGNVVIAGKGFGSAAGRVLASGLAGFPGGAAALQVTAWTEFEIDAVLPAAIRGVPDLNGISAQVFTAAGKSFTLGNGKFVAAREEITLTTQLDQVILLKPSAQWPGVMAADGGVHRQLGGNSLDCPAPGTDELLFPPPPRGFDVSGIAMGNGTTWWQVPPRRVTRRDRTLRRPS